MIICPFIRLDDRTIRSLQRKMHLKELKVTLVYGKNEDDRSRSLSKQDFMFLRSFPNIEIRYEPKLHAKFYSNEREGLLSSMNLLEYSIARNIEVGVGVEFGYQDEMANDISRFFRAVIQDAQLEYCKQSDKKGDAEVSVDVLTDFLKAPSSQSKLDEQKKGYCIRCREGIKFDPQLPFCKSCYSVWAVFENYMFEEAHCHGCGKDEPTSMSLPQCLDCWKVMVGYVVPNSVSAGN